METWKNIPGYEGLYQVSNFGNVKSLPRIKISGRGGPQQVKERILAKIDMKRGYRYACLCKEGKRKLIFIHKLVAENFIGLRPFRHVINHKNGDKYDNRVENLEWVTHTDHILFHGRKGEKNSRAKLTEKQVKTIRKLANTGLSHRDIANRYDVQKPCIRKIITRQSWNHI